MKINVNGSKQNVKSLSELSFKEFNKVLIKAKVSGLDEYLSIFLGMEKEDLLGARIKSHTVEALHAFIFDIDVTSKIKEVPRAISYEGRYYSKDELRLDTFGKDYYYDLYEQRYKAKQINLYELGMYALAIAISDKLDDRIESIYKDLCNDKWTKYLPISFFLLKKSKRKTLRSIKLSILYTLGLRAMKLRMRTSKKKLTLWAKT